MQGSYYQQQGYSHPEVKTPFKLSGAQIVGSILTFGGCYFLMTVYNGGVIFKQNRNQIMGLAQQKAQLQEQIKDLKAQKERLELTLHLKK
ncbi:hypothetical protein [Candidatus Phytoplasma meliae]|uniref:Uncharacterized protein n=1 Tax=Candidatus Phytoplasma meliae TaxID=1848402 RepID=A0ABS5CYW1_9MOLU|nr:hypothetical protein [Candidatus Phytoplasma meliae]MBP5836164.1 hypothetical protein [Candidatus Phytoplasma meliae]MBP5836267.1 hypothetical protein [Candidatus Phytoplasma meliae]